MPTIQLFDSFAGTSSIKPSRRSSAHFARQCLNLKLHNVPTVTIEERYTDLDRTLPITWSRL